MKLKTKKTLIKRVRVTRNGKIVRKQIGIGHLKVKWNASRRSRKNASAIQTNFGHRSIFKKLLAKGGKRI